MGLKRGVGVSKAVQVSLSVAFWCGCGEAVLPLDREDTTVDATDVSDAVDTAPDLEVPPLPPDPGSVTVLAGDAARGHFDGTATQARFQGVGALCRHGDTLYVTDTFAGTVRAVDLATGATSTLAGKAGRFSLSDGSAETARFASPRGLACIDGGLLVADSGALRKVGFDGETTTVAGFPGSPGFADGPAIEARIGYLVHALVVHADGRVFFSDRSNDALRVVDPRTWEVTTLIDGLSGPGGLALDPAKPDLVFFANTFADVVLTFDLERGTLSALPLDPAPDTPQALALDGGTVWVAGFGAELWRYNVTSGRGARVSSEFPGTFASMVHVPATTDREARLVYAALEPEVLRQVGLDSRADTRLAGPDFASPPADGPVASARFGFLSGVAAHDSTLFIADEAGLRRLRSGVVDTVEADALRADGELAPVTSLLVDGERLWVSLAEAGRVVSLDLASLASPDTSPAVISILESLAQPAGLIAGPGGVIVAERGAHRLTLLADEGARVLVGDGLRGSVDGTLAEARFDSPHALAWDAARGHLWVGQSVGHLRLVELDRDRVTTVIRPADPTDGALDAARLGLPLGLVFWRDLFILDADPGGLKRLVFEGDAPTRLETLVGGVLAGGMPMGATAPLDEAILGSASAGVVVGQDLVVVAEQAVYRIHLGDRLVGGGGVGVEPTGCDFDVALGTGSDSFTPLTETLLLERGAQGLQHILLALAADEVPAGLHVTTAALYPRGGVDEAPLARMALTIPWQTGRALGVLFVIEDPAPIVAAPLDLVVTVSGPAGLGCARAPVVVRWAP